MHDRLSTSAAAPGKEQGWKFKFPFVPSFPPCVSAAMPGTYIRMGLKQINDYMEFRLMVPHNSRMRIGETWYVRSQ